MLATQYIIKYLCRILKYKAKGVSYKFGMEANQCWRSSQAEHAVVGMEAN